MGVDLRKLLLAHQHQLVARLGSAGDVFEHPGSKGQATETAWTNVIDNFLPERYEASAAFVLDANGAVSDQIDLVIYDRHFSPLLFEQGVSATSPPKACTGSSRSSRR